MGLHLRSMGAYGHWTLKPQLGFGNVFLGEQGQVGHDEENLSHDEIPFMPSPVPWV